LERLPLDKNVVRVFHNGGVLDTLQDLRDDAAKCADASLWALSDTDLITAVDQVHALQQTITAVLLHLVREADARDIPAAQHCRGTAVWLRSRLLLDAGTARRLVDQAAALARHAAVDAALCSGTIHVGQVGAITDALDALPIAAALDAVPATIEDDATAAGAGVHIDSRTAPEVAAAAEAALLDLAAEFPPAPLRRLGARILDHVAPQVAERLDEKALEREERRAWQARGLTLSPPSGGMIRISGHLTIEDAATITATSTRCRSPRSVTTTPAAPPSAAPTPSSRCAGWSCVPATFPPPAANLLSLPSPSRTTRSPAAWASAGWTTASGSARRSRAGSPVTPKSCPSCWAVPARSSTPVGPAGWRPARCAGRWSPGIAAVPSPTATGSHAEPTRTM
jgi:hypothetical protein